MAAFNFYSPDPVFLDLLGLQPLAGGFLYFYDKGTTTPRNTWNDPDLAAPHLNSNPVTLDSGGRANVKIFLDGSYTVVCKDSLGATIWTRDVIPGGTSGTTIPALVSGNFLTNDGVNLLWQPVRQLPDPTGSTGQVPTTNGSGYTLQNLPTAPALDIVVTTSSVRIGDGVSITKFLEQWGSDTAVASGTVSTNKTVTFPTAYTTVPTVHCSPTSSTQPGGPLVTEVGGVTTTGFTVLFDVAEGSAPSANIVNPVPFRWSARGTKDVP